MLPLWEGGITLRASKKRMPGEGIQVGSGRGRSDTIPYTLDSYYTEYTEDREDTSNIKTQEAFQIEAGGRGVNRGYQNNLRHKFNCISLLSWAPYPGTITSSASSLP